MDYQPGDRIGDYEVVKTLGAGGMGKVYQVRNVLSERLEAMKVLLPNLEHDPELADRFLREIKVQAALEHPNIAGLRTAQRVDNQLIMIMEFVDGEALDRMLARGPLPAEQAIGYVTQVLEALSYAHARGVVHRDIKPPNIMVTPAGVAKLMDFGIARIAEDRKLTQTGRTVGSLYYMSPEQIKGLQPDPRSDLYSLGITLYELVTGRRPFQGDSDYSIMAGHLNQPAAPPVELNPSLPRPLSDVILLAIAKEPERRFQGAEAFRQALLSVKQGLEAPGQAAAPAHVAGAVQPAPVRPGSAHGLYMALGSVVTLLALGFAAIELPKRFRASGDATPATQTAPSPTPTPPAEPSAPVVPEATPAPAAVAEQPAATTPEPARVAPAAPTPAATPAPTSVPAPTPTPAAAPTAAQKPPPPVLDLGPLRRRFELLGTRANTVRSALRRLESEQQRQGLGLRADWKSAATRMAMALDEAEAALRAGDGPAAKAAMDRAEREVERLEPALGM